MKSVKIKALNIQKLIDFIEKNNVDIPEFQRGYVWKEIQVKKLFDSLVKRYPIGTFIIWETNQKKIGQRNLFSTEPMKGHKRYFILDGQQRLLTLYYLCKQKKFLDLKHNFEEVYEHKQKNLIEFEHFYFDNVKNPELQYRKDKNQEFNFLDFTRKLGNNYQFPLIIISIDNYEKAIELFERINQTGTKISTSAIFLSEAWNKKTNLGKILRKYKEEKAESLIGKLDNVIFVHTFAIIFQLEGFVNNKEESLDISLGRLKGIAKLIKEENSKKFEKIFKDVLKAITEATSFLSNPDILEIKNIKELPSQTMISILAIFFYYNLKKILLLSLKKLNLKSGFGDLMEDMLVLSTMKI